jgi:hypothetical protein
MFMGLIGESCKDSMRKNLAEAMKMACSGIIDENPRVRYSGLSCVALLLTELAPTAQKKYHTDLMPVFLNMLTTEQTLKIQTHVVSTIINFAKGLMTEDDDEETTDASSTKLMEQYSSTLFESLITLLNKGMEQNYEPLQEEVMNLLSVVATIIDTEFAKYYSVLVPIMTNILRNVPSTTMSQMTLRARTIEALGYMIEAVTDKKAEFVAGVQEITAFLITLKNSGLTNDDPQTAAIKETLAKIAGFLKEDFQQFLPLLLPTLLADT